MTEEELQAMLAQLKVLTEETDEGGIAPACDLCELCEGATPIPIRDYTDDQLLTFLEIYNYDLNKTAYNVLLRKAKNDGISLSSGIKLPDNSEYWLRLARNQRFNRTGMMRRADEPEVTA